MGCYNGGRERGVKSGDKISVGKCVVSGELREVGGRLCWVVLVMGKLL